jgi:hypothetical protein
VTSIKGVEFILRASKTCESITLVLHIIHLAPSDLRPATLSILFARDPHHCVYPKSEPFPRWINDFGKATYRFVSYHQTGYNTSDPLGILGLLCAEGKKTSLHRVIPPSKTRNSRSRPKPFLSNQGLRARRPREHRKGRASRSFSYTRRTTTYTSRSSLDQLAKTPT